MAQSSNSGEVERLSKAIEQMSREIKKVQNSVLSDVKKKQREIRECETRFNYSSILAKEKERLKAEGIQRDALFNDQLQKLKLACEKRTLKLTEKLHCENKETQKEALIEEIDRLKLLNRIKDGNLENLTKKIQLYSEIIRNQRFVYYCTYSDFRSYFVSPEVYDTKQMTRPTTEQSKRISQEYFKYGDKVDDKIFEIKKKFNVLNSEPDNLLIIEQSLSQEMHDLLKEKKRLKNIAIKHASIKRACKDNVYCFIQLLIPELFIKSSQKKLSETQKKNQLLDSQLMIINKQYEKVQEKVQQIQTEKNKIAQKNTDLKNIMSYMKNKSPVLKKAEKKQEMK